MSRLTINSNVSSLNAQRNLGKATSQLQNSFSRLSSGMRINKAGDDAAGLSVSSLLKIDVKIFSQGIRNLNDGVSYLNIAESAINELGNIVTRIGELAEQGENGTLGDSQRKALQEEVAALQKEYNRIIKSTRFNGNSLLTGAGTKAVLQGGYGTSAQLATQIGLPELSDAFGLSSAGETLRASTSSGGEEANGNSTQAKISADGRFVAFVSTTSNLIPGVSGQQVYLKNLQTGELSLVSSSLDGTVGSGSNPSVSADSRFVAFESNSTDLIPGVSGQQVYLKNLQTGELSLASGSSDGASGNGNSFGASISADGQFVAFRSNSTDLIPGVSGQQVYLKNLQTGELSLVSSSSDGTAGNGNSTKAAISADGRFVAFEANSADLIPGVSGEQIYLKDLQTGKLSLVSSSSDGVAGNGNTMEAAISADGRFVAFVSTANNLIPGVTGTQVYRKSLETGEIILVSSSASGQTGSISTHPIQFSTVPTAISSDGRFVLFAGFISGLGDGISGANAYRKDLLSGELEIINRSTNGNVGNLTRISPVPPDLSISADGRLVSFSSSASVLTTGDTNGLYDIFVRDLSKSGVQEISGMVVSNQASARFTLNLVRRYQEELSLYQSGIGAALSRAESFISTLQTASLNSDAAASQILDTDVAEESARLTAYQIIQQSATSVLSQASLQPELALTLLRNL